MKTSIFFLLILLCACASPPVKSELTEAEKNEVKALVQGIFDDVWGGYDSTKILNYHTEDFVILENGEVWTNQEITDFVRESLDNNRDEIDRINSMEYISMDKYGDAINVAYHNYATFKKNDSIVGNGQWLESATAIETEQGWRLKTMHSTWVPPNKRE